MTRHLQCSARYSPCQETVWKWGLHGLQSWRQTLVDWAQWRGENHVTLQWLKGTTNFTKYTLPKTNRLPLKTGHPKWKLVQCIPTLDFQVRCWLEGGYAKRNHWQFTLYQGTEKRPFAKVIWHGAWEENTREKGEGSHQEFNINHL